MKFFNLFKKKDPVRSLRQEFSLWGIDTSHLTDKQLEERLTKFTIAFSNAGISAVQAAKNLSVYEQ